jgi:membrane AbrB-like protein
MRSRELLAILATLVVASLSGLAALALRVPAGGILGPLLLLGGFNIATGRVPRLSRRWQQASMILTGTVIGSGIDTHLLDSITRFWPAAVAMTVWIISVAMTLGWLVSRRTGLDLPTCLLCLAPGGTGEMTAAAMDLGADARLVAMVGMLRVTLTIVSVPLLLGYLVLRH